MQYPSKALCTLIAWCTIFQLGGQVTEVSTYAFGHSLIDHRPPAIPTPSDETTIFHWMAELAESANSSFFAGGQYGFLTTHVNLPPMAQWGYAQVPAVWDDQIESFAESRINSILITPANFIQYVSATDPHPLDYNTSLAVLTETIFDWANAQKADLRYYIYGNWPEMDLQEYYPPNIPAELEIDNYHSISIEQGENWWPDYQDALLSSRPQYQTRLIPVGLILSKILQLESMGDVPFEEIYEDSAPHGRASLYFMAGMITYMAMFEQKIPADYMPNNQVHIAIRSQLAELTDFVWDELLNFNLANGDSRVFYNLTSSTKEDGITGDISVFPNPAQEVLIIQGLSNRSKVQITDIFGSLKSITTCRNTEEQIDISSIPNGFYYIQIMDEFNRLVSIKRIAIAH